MKIFTNKKFEEFKGVYDRTIETLTNENLVQRKDIKNLKKINFDLNDEILGLKKNIAENDKVIAKLTDEIQALKVNVRKAYTNKTTSENANKKTTKSAKKETAPKKKGGVKNAK